MASDDMIVVGNWSCWTDQDDQWCAKGPDGHGGMVNQLEALLLDRIRDTIATAIAHIEERDRLKAEIVDWTEREAACCPEDVGFDELIKAQAKEIGQLKAKLAEARGQLQDWGEHPGNAMRAADEWEQRVKEAERQRIVGVLQELIVLSEAEHPGRPSTIVLTLKTAIKAIEEPAP